MPQLIASAPVLLVSDVVASANYFRDKLGFRYERFWGEPPSFCMPSRDDLIVMLSQVPAGQPVDTDWRSTEGVWNAYFWVDDARGIYEEFVQRGAMIVCEPELKPYQVLEFTIRDLDGHHIGVGQPTD